jgi:hypothetical protein
MNNELLDLLLKSSWKLKSNVNLKKNRFNLIKYRYK